ncbi:Uncharacterised protein [Staphylococcus xylosus]|nr:hypothetical protein [Staphylococcus xylosus]SCU31672.1 Uncharacterised protein [Staphylococcus xylosus]
MDKLTAFLAGGVALLVFGSVGALFLSGVFALLKLIWTFIL